MFGLADVGVSLAFLFVILSAALCVVWGIVNWNRPKEDEEAEVKEEWEWEKKDDAIMTGGKK